MVNGVKLAICKIISGAPQGTVLGSILFLLFINDLKSVVRHSKIGFFADDTRISKKIGYRRTSSLNLSLCSCILFSVDHFMTHLRSSFSLVQSS